MWILVTLISNRISSDEKNCKCFVGYANEYKIKPFTIILRKSSAYVKSYDAGTTKWMFFLIKGEEY